MYTEEKEKILIADDSQLNREMLAEMLGDSYDYIYAEDGERLLQLLSQNIKADVLLLDMHMPNMSGMDVLKVMNEQNWLETLPVIIISAENDMGFIRNAYRLGVTDYIQRPFDAFMVQRRVQNVLAMYARNKRLVHEVERQVRQREKVNNTLINILSRVLETVNQESGNHTLRVQQITKKILRRLLKLTDRYNLTEDDVALICSVSALHDIGKVAVPQEILNKPGKLTPEEWELMKLHTVKGDEMLWGLDVNQEEKLMATAHAICRHHHERYDGSGYPDGLKGDEIPISAQVTAIADVYDALTSDRCYKKAFSHEKAIGMIVSGECGSFNPLLIQCLTDVADELLAPLGANKADGGDTQGWNDDAFGLETLPADDRAAFFAACERTKKEFYAKQCGGIQFEYDAVARRVLSLVYYDGMGNKRSLSDTDAQLLNAEDWERLQGKMRMTTPENPAATMLAQVRLNDAPRWQMLTAQSIWTQNGDRYIGIVGQFTDVHDELAEDPLANGIRAEAETAAEVKKRKNTGGAAFAGYYRDALTGAYSLAYLDGLRASLEGAKGVAALDVDRFQSINDAYGRAAGDAALRHIAETLRSCIRPHGVLIRCGGDDFLMIFHEIGERSFFEKLEQIRDGVCASVIENYPEIKLSVSIGGVYCDAPLEQAAAEAEKAMYRDKYRIKR